jgi:hypothetical protein
VDKHLFQVTKYEHISMEAWRKLKAELFRTYKLEIRQNQDKIQWGSNANPWDTGVFEWDYKITPDSKPEEGTLELRIKRRAADPARLAIEATISDMLEEV